MDLLVELLPWLAIIIPLIPQFIPHRVIAARERGEKSTKRTIRIPVPRRFPIRSLSGQVILPREKAFQVITEERFGRFLNLASAFFGLGMLFMVWEVVYGSVYGMSVLSLTGYGYFTVGINDLAVLILFFVPLGLEIFGAVLIVDARRKMNSPAWTEVRGEMLAWSAWPHSRRPKVALTDDEREFLERLEREEEEY